MTVGQVRTKDLPDTGSIGGTDTVLVDNGTGTRSKTITELAAAVAAIAGGHWEQQWSGVFFGGAGAVDGWFQNAFLSTMANTAVEYPIAHDEVVTITDLIVHVWANNTTGDTVLVVTHGGADTPIKVTIPAGTTGAFSDTTHGVGALGQGDLIGIAIHSTAAGAGRTLFFTCSLRYSF